MANIVTELQNQVNDICSMFFNFAGTLQRDAPKASVGSETITQAVEFDVEEQTKKMVNDLVAASVAIDAKIDILPQFEQSDLEKRQKIVELWEHHNKLNESIKSQSNELQQLLAELQEIHHTIAVEKIFQNANMSSSDDATDDENGKPPEKQESAF